MFRSKKYVYMQGYSGAPGLTWGRESLDQELLHAYTSALATHTWKPWILQNCEDHYDHQCQAVFRNGMCISGFYEARVLKPFDSQMEPKLIWAFTNVILLAEELAAGGDGCEIACVLTIWLFVTDGQMSGRNRQEKREVDNRTGEEEEGYFWWGTCLGREEWVKKYSGTEIDPK